MSKRNGVRCLDFGPRSAKRRLKYRAWGDGYQHSRLLERDDGFTVWYEADGTAVGVLTCNADDDYELGGRLIEA